MKTEDKISIVQPYLDLLKSLNENSKLEIISRLTSSIKKTRKKKFGSLKLLKGAFIPEKSAEDIIKEIRDARHFKGKNIKL